MADFTEVFWISLASIIVGAFGLSVKYCLKSKCEHISICWGSIDINRRVDLEVQEEIREIEMGRVDNDEETKSEMKSEKK